MADAFITPLVGGVMWLASTKVASSSINRLRLEKDDWKVPMIGVMGAFVFAAQMINFTIPGTGSSGHLGGGMLLAAILGPYAGFLAMTAILAIQALFFADGGLLALGCNIFNLGFYTCFVAYPYIYKRIIAKGYSTARIVTASTLASVIGLQLGSFSVVLQTMISGKIDLSFAAFALLMQAIHLAIGIVEGLVTAAVINFVWKARPELLEGAGKTNAEYNISFKKVIIIFILAALIIGGILSWYASEYPDGLEWSLYHSSRQEEAAEQGWLYQRLAELQQTTSVLPDYSFKDSEGSRLGTSSAGTIGVVLTLLLSIGAVAVIKLAAGYTKKKDV